jgi:hypothetical protein
MKVLENVDKNEAQLRSILFGRLMQKRLQKKIEKVQNDASFETLIEQLRLKSNG